MGLNKFVVLSLTALCLLTGTVSVSPNLAEAQSVDNCSKLKNDFDEIVGGTPKGLPDQCASADGWILRAIRVMLILAGSAAVLSIMYSGFRLIVMSPDPNSRTGALKGLRWSIIGLVVVLLATTLVTLVTRFFTDTKVI